MRTLGDIGSRLRQDGVDRSQGLIGENPNAARFLAVGEHHLRQRDICFIC